MTCKSTKRIPAEVRSIWNAFSDSLEDLFYLKTETYTTLKVLRHRFRILTYVTVYDAKVISECVLQDFLVQVERKLMVSRTVV